MKKLLVITFICFFLIPDIPAQTTKQVSSTELFDVIQWREVGPWRGGRSCAVTGVPGQPNLYYMGTTGGGVWRTQDGGQTWKNISDGFLKTGSVGAIELAPSDPNVIYLGMGEHAARGVMTSHGDGMYKSTDAGSTWTYIGLPESHHIAAIQTPSLYTTIYTPRRPNV